MTEINEADAPVLTLSGKKTYSVWEPDCVKVESKATTLMQEGLTLKLIDG